MLTSTGLWWLYQVSKWRILRLPLIHMHTWHPTQLKLQRIFSIYDEISFEIVSDGKVRRFQVCSHYYNKFVNLFLSDSGFHSSVGHQIYQHSSIP
jgi:hypothetical protein